ncbi:hypothetical protein ACFFX0_12375 [Citricoccus parietis]|uniref:Uncharacterized protein n=1 Tax=Citricoccus parietis TaxID=592307 RepID=A0ABV5FZ57_9MICC
MGVRPGQQDPGLLEQLTDRPGQVPAGQAVVVHSEHPGPLSRGRAEPRAVVLISGVEGASRERHRAQGGGPGPVAQQGLHPVQPVPDHSHGGGTTRGPRAPLPVHPPAASGHVLVLRQLEEPGHQGASGAAHRAVTDGQPGPRSRPCRARYRSRCSVRCRRDPGRRLGRRRSFRLWPGLGG